MKTLQPTRKDDIKKVSKNEHSTNEDKSKQIHSQVKKHHEHLKKTAKIEKCKKPKQHFHDGPQSRTQLHLGEPSNKHTKSNKGVTEEIEHISNNNSQRFKQRKTQERKMKKQKIQLNYNKKSPCRREQIIKGEILLRARANLITISIM